MKSVEASATTREDAIKKALDELGIEMYEADKIEILDEGSKGLFGFGARPVRVKVIAEHLEDDDKPSSGGPDRERGQSPREPRGKADREARPRRSAGRNDRGKGGGRERTERGGRDGRGRGGGQERGGRRKDGERKDGERKDSERKDSERKDSERKPRAERPAREDAPAAPAAREERAEPAPRKRPRPERDAEQYTPITDAQGREAAALLAEIIAKMGMKAEAVFERTEDGAARINVSSEDGAILIGRKGKSLSALQYLINRVLARSDSAENTERIVVDVEGYLDRRRTTLEAMALDFAKKAKETRRNIRMKPLSPQERRIVHVALEGDEDVRTFSHGDSLYRSVVISPKDARPDEPRDSRGRGRGDRSRGGRHHARAANNDDDIDAGQFGD